MTHTVVVRILGRDYTIRSQQPAEEVERVARFVEEKLAETAGGRAVDTRDLTVLTLLNLAGEHMQLRAEGQRETAELEARLRQMLDQFAAVNSGCES